MKMLRAQLVQYLLAEIRLQVRRDGVQSQPMAQDLLDAVIAGVSDAIERKVADLAQILSKALGSKIADETAKQTAAVLHKRLADERLTTDSAENVVAKALDRWARDNANLNEKGLTAALNKLKTTDVLISRKQISDLETLIERLVAQARNVPTQIPTTTLSADPPPAGIVQAGDAASTGIAPTADPGAPIPSSLKPTRWSFARLRSMGTRAPSRANAALVATMLLLLGLLVFGGIGYLIGAGSHGRVDAQAQMSASAETLNPQLEDLSDISQLALESLKATAKDCDARWKALEAQSDKLGADTANQSKISAIRRQQEEIVRIGTSANRWAKIAVAVSNRAKTNRDQLSKLPKDRRLAEKQRLGIIETVVRDKAQADWTSAVAIRLRSEIDAVKSPSATLASDPNLRPAQ